MAAILLSASRSAGTYTFSAPVPVGSTGVRLLVDRSLLSSRSARLDWMLELSVDAGATWWGLGGSGIDFASVVDPKFVEAKIGLAASGMQRGLLICDGPNGTRLAARSVLKDETIRPGYEVTNASRQLRGSVTLNEALQVSATLDWLTD